ncbi:hypothetical protein CGRA01v4_00551 [Colletotrichum graminicola]|nr:hypothetical protein CGRA01v4_00551 [Colletotrichum graminicola]
MTTTGEGGRAPCRVLCLAAPLVSCGGEMGRCLLRWAPIGCLFLGSAGTGGTRMRQTEVLGLAVRRSAAEQ